MAGYMEELETFNYTLTSAEIKRQYDSVRATDSDLNGIPDLLEDIMLSSPSPFVGVPFAITGTIEAEQFDRGGKGIAYTNVSANHWTNDYRPSGMEITNCTDKGGGYCVDKLVAGDWLKYSIDVRVRQNYALEVRMAGIGNTGGVFQIEFSTNGAPAYTNTGPLTVTSTNWRDVTRRMVWLEYGTNMMKFTCLTNAAGTNYVGKFNYISIYPDWVQGISNIVTEVTVSTNDLMTGDSWQAATNNAARIQAAIDSLPSNMQTTNGGRVIIPAGTWYVAQKVIDETLQVQHNAAIYVYKSNLEIKGAGKTNTVLKCFSRSTTPLYVGANSSLSPVQSTNIIFSSFTLKSRPHMLSIADSGFGGYTNDWETGAVNPGINSIGSLFFCAGYSSTAFAHNVILTNCVFENASFNATLFGSVSNILVAHCDYLFRADGINGAYPRQITHTSVSTTLASPLGQVGFFTGRADCFNVTFTDNTFNGNPSITGVNTDYLADVADGIFWTGSSANCFVARNAITNYGLEGVQFNSGSCTAVANDFFTFVSLLGTCALADTALYGTLHGVTNDVADLTQYFLGNVVSGGRSGQKAWWGDNVSTAYAINYHCTGNSFTLLPAFPRWDDYPSVAVTCRTSDRGNISGNAMVAGEQGVRWREACTNVIVLKNDFSSATHKAIIYDESTASARNIQIVKNILNQGASYHFNLSFPESGYFFLWKNTYTNGISNVDPFLDAASSPVHFIR